MCSLNSKDKYPCHHSSIKEYRSIQEDHEKCILLKHGTCISFFDTKINFRFFHSEFSSVFWGSSPFPGLTACQPSDHKMCQFLNPVSFHKDSEFRDCHFPASQNSCIAEHIFLAAMLWFCPFLKSLLI